MLVYLAARYSRRTEIKAFVPLLAENHIKVRSRWLDETLPPEHELSQVTPQSSRNSASDDIEDIEACDTLVLFSEDPTIGVPRGGRHVEFGYALAKGKRIVVIGGQENIFHYLPQIVHYSTVQSFLEAEAISNELVAD